MWEEVGKAVRHPDLELALRVAAVGPHGQEIGIGQEHLLKRKNGEVPKTSPKKIQQGEDRLELEGVIAGAAPLGHLLKELLERRLRGQPVQEAPHGESDAVPMCGRHAGDAVGKEMEQVPGENRPAFHSHPSL